MKINPFKCSERKPGSNNEEHRIIKQRHSDEKMLTVKLRMQKWNELVENEKRLKENSSEIYLKKDALVKERKKKPIKNDASMDGKEIITISKKQSIDNQILNLQGQIDKDDEIEFGSKSAKLNDLKSALLNNKLNKWTNLEHSDLNEKRCIGVLMNEKTFEKRLTSEHRNSLVLPNLVDYKLVKLNDSDRTQKSIKVNSHDLDLRTNFNFSANFNGINKGDCVAFDENVDASKFRNKIRNQPNQSDSPDQINQLAFKYQNIKNFKRSVSDLSSVVLRKNFVLKNNQSISENKQTDTDCSNELESNSKLDDQLNTSFVSSGK